MVERPNTAPIGKGRKTLTLKALHYSNAFVAAYAQVCMRSLFCVFYIGFDPPYGSLQLPIFLKYSVSLLLLATRTYVRMSDILRLGTNFLWCVPLPVTDRKSLVFIGYNS